MADNQVRRMDAEDRAEQIIRVATEHFAQHGSAGASMSAIAREAGVTRALVYHYFPNKEALLGAVTRRAGERILEAIRPDPGLSPGDALRWALGVCFDEADQQSPAPRFGIPFATMTSSSVAGSRPEVQLDWFLEFAQMPANGYTRLALSSWFALVEHAARSHAELGLTTRDEAIEMCINAFRGITGISFSG